MINTEISPDVAALVAALTKVSPGSTVTYRALSQVIGRDVQEVRWVLLRALHIAARDHGAVFGNERGVGYARLTTDKLPDVGATTRARVRRASRLAAKRIRFGSAKANDLPPDVQRQINAELSALALIEHVASDKAASPGPQHDQRPEPVAVTARRLLGLEDKAA